MKALLPLFLATLLTACGTADTRSQTFAESSHGITDGCKVTGNYGDGTLSFGTNEGFLQMISASNWEKEFKLLNRNQCSGSGSADCWEVSLTGTGKTGSERQFYGCWDFDEGVACENPDGAWKVKVLITSAGVIIWTGAYNIDTTNSDCGDPGNGCLRPPWALDNSGDYGDEIGITPENELNKIMLGGDDQLFLGDSGGPALCE